MYIKKERKSCGEGISEGKIKLLYFLFLTDLRDTFIQNNNTSNISNYVCLCTSEMNDSSDMREGRQELGLFYYKWTMKWTWISCKCILQSQPLKCLLQSQPLKKVKKEVQLIC